MSEDVRAAAERAARTSYGRLLALVAARSRDVASAEDALADAFAAALASWPERGIPDRPEAWLLTVARRAMGHGERRASTRLDAAHVVEMLHDEAAENGDDGFPDERLRLLFVCAHPAIGEAVRTPLMLQVVLGVDAARIAAAFLTAPAAMAQRLVRAKAKIRDAGIAFEPPDPRDLAGRTADVLNAIYAAYGAGWDGDGGARGLSAEAIYLGRLTCSLLPQEPEAKGLLALMLYCEARTAARRDADGRFVPLADQDPRLWSRDLIIEAEGLLTTASRAGRFGRFQCEAAIQSIHVQRPFTGRTNWTALAMLYDLLADRAPSLGVLVARAAARAETGAPAAALAELDALPQERVAAYQPYWATRARVLRLLGSAAAEAARSRAIALTDDPAVREYLAGAP